MRPLELTIRNFRSYAGDDATFDFRGRGLVGIVGPIGSGKSSLLDAIAFALYGRTPTVAAGTKSLIHQRRDRATVSLRFGIGDEVWEVTRALRRKGQSQHGLQRLESDSADAATLENFVMEAEVNAKIVELLGLEFGGFSRSIMLAQGRFAEFLTSRPADRDKVLKGVFGYDRLDEMRTAAKELAAAGASQVDALTLRLEAADSLAERIKQTAAHVAELDKRLEQLQKAEAEIGDLDSRIAEGDRVASHSVTKLDQLADIGQQLPTPVAIEELLATARAAAANRARLAEELESAQAKLRAADQGLASLDPSSTRQRIDAINKFDTVRRQLAEQHAAAAARVKAAAEEAKLVAARHRDALERHAAAEATVEATRHLQTVAEAALDKATKARHDMHRADMANTLRRSLNAGDDCPVCSRAVEAVPTSDDVAMDEADAAVTSAEEALNEARTSLERATKHVADAAAELRAATEAQERSTREGEVAASDEASLGAKVDKATAEYNAATADGDAVELRERLDSAEGALGDARKQVDAARNAHDGSIRAATEADKGLNQLRLVAADAGRRLGVELPALDELESLEAAATSIRTRLHSDIELTRTARKAAEEDAARALADRRSRLEELGVEGDFPSALAKAQAEVEARQRLLEDQRTELAASSDLRKQREGAVASQARYATIASELTDSRFVRYVLDEEKQELAALGSDHFERLSSGRYRFSEDGEFHIVDLTAADATRRADSLSGGETFLASLALALALAEMVARGGGRLDAFFLDEGFGSLDPEHLDLAMEGIERLAADDSDRLVLVVSHVPDMQQRIEDLVRLDRDPVTGDTKVMRP